MPKAAIRVPLSSPKLPVALTPIARTYLRDIETYTVTRWGEQQWATYEATIAQALESIADNPEIGRARDEIRTGYRSCVIGQHLIFYRIMRRAVVVIGIISARSDIHRALGG